MRSAFSAVLAGSLLWLALSSAWGDVFEVRDIEVEGLQRISAGTVFTYLPVKVGERFDEAQSAEVIRALYRTGFFDDVELRRRGDVLVVKVTERPAIADISFEGNKDIPTEQLTEVLKQVGIAKGRVFNRSVLERLERELRQQYFARGKYNVKIETTIDRLPRNRVDVAIKISEGRIAKIREVSIVGNEDYDEEDLLDELDSGVPGPLALFSSRDEYSKPKLAGDLEKLRSIYLDNGYINFNIDSTQVAITPDKKDIYITIDIDEGEQYTIKDVRLAGNLVVPEEELRGLITFGPGEIFSRSKITDTTTKITERLGDEGYAFANVNPVPEVDEDKREVTLTLFVDPGQRVYVRRINFIGNYKTRDEVFRREMRQMEGGWYSTSKINRSKVRLQRLPYVESVNIQTKRVPGSEDQVDLDVSITERLAGSFVIGAGYSQGQGFLFNMSLSQDNFFGTGKQVSLTFNNSQVTQIYSLSYTNPYYTLDGVSRGFTLFYRKTDTDQADVSRYTTDRFGGSINYGIPLTEYDSLRIGGGYDQTTVKLGSDAADELVDFLDTYGDTYNTYNLSGSFTHDTRDRTIFATRGNLQRIGAEIAAPGSDLEYWKLNYRIKQHIPFSETVSLALEADVAYGDGYGDTPDLPFFEKYYAGGIRSVRGYQANSLGPRDSLDDPLGGSFRTLASAELVFPMLGLEDVSSFRLGLFADAGNVFARYEDFETGELRTSVGIAAYWLSPVGPLTFSIAQALNDKPDDELEFFQFSLGTGF